MKKLGFKINDAIIAIILAVTIVISTSALSDNLVDDGAELYIERCALCHGNLGFGDGLMAAMQSGYPPTSMMTGKFGHEKSDIETAIRWGGASGKMSPYSPPWQYELSDQQISSLVDFIFFLRENQDAGLAILREHSQNKTPSLEEGMLIYSARCVICHGINADGKGALANKVIRNPPPYNLRESILNDEGLHEIVSLGGDGVARSPQMPPWRDELLQSEILSIVLFLKSIRNEERTVE